MWLSMWVKMPWSSLHNKGFLFNFSECFRPPPFWLQRFTARLFMLKYFHFSEHLNFTFFYIYIPLLTQTTALPPVLLLLLLLFLQQIVSRKENSSWFYHISSKYFLVLYLWVRFFIKSFDDLMLLNTCVQDAFPSAKQKTAVQKIHTMTIHWFKSHQYV